MLNKKEMNKIINDSIQNTMEEKMNEAMKKISDVIANKEQEVLFINITRHINLKTFF